MNKDQTIGAAIFLICAIIAVLYVVTLAYPSWLSNIGVQATSSTAASVQFWVIAVPVAVGFIAILAIGSWIGWTMAATPPPKPIEELQTETEQNNVDKTTAS